ncbi:MAG: acyloxyacyl hydrolase [Pyrinomonadaceae bacterium]|nr:acyloxyacyl hydrolase [Pyrinomonadaceae bacterium]
MPDYLKLPGSLFFILFAFVFNNSAQTLNEKKLPAKEKPSSFLKDSRLPGETKQTPPEHYSPVKPDSKKSSGTEPENQKQVEPEDWSLRRGDKTFSVEYGVSPFNPSNFAGPKEFDVYGRDLHLFTFRVGRIIGTKRNVSYEYMFGATPLAIFTKNEVVNKSYISPTQTPNIAPTKRETTYGIGVQPVNFKFMFFAKNRLKPYAQVGAGILFTNKAVPVPQSTLFQLTGDFGGGLMYLLSEKRAVNFGYKYFHISNGNINEKINNPGFNANVFYVSYSFLFR